MKRLTWRPQPHERGLAGVTQGARGFDLRRGAEELIHVRPLIGAHRFAVAGWYYYAVADDLPDCNTCREPVATLEEAKAAAEAYVREHLEKADA